MISVEMMVVMWTTSLEVLSDLEHLGSMEVLDTTVTLTGVVNQCEDTFTKFSYFSQYLLITSFYTTYATFIDH